MSSLYALLKMCNQLVDRADSKKKKKKKKKYIYIYRYIYILYIFIYIYILYIFITLTHVVVLSLSANRQFNLSRRELLRPCLNKNNQALCDPLVPLLRSYLGTTSINKWTTLQRRIRLA